MDTRLAQWIDEIRSYNKRLHLVGAGTMDGFAAVVEESLELLRLMDEPVLADIGSGSGLPGIPYAVIHPGAQVHLVERSRKKATFLQHVVDHLALDNVRVHPEDPVILPIGPFPSVISRAFSPRADLPKVLGRMLDCGGRYYELGTLQDRWSENLGFELRREYTGSSALMLRVYDFMEM